MQHTAYIALGSNLGDRQAHLQAAIQQLQADSDIQLQLCSRFYLTDPVGGPPGQPQYLNAVVAVRTSLSPHQLLQRLLAIERRLGRTRTQPCAPRTIDLDLLLYDQAVIDQPDLTLPHPRMHQRYFVMAPLAEIAPDAIHPVLGRSASRILQELQHAPDHPGQDRR